jgi:putative glycosyl hydrolase/Big-like domain-containing protein
VRHLSVVILIGVAASLVAASTASAARSEFFGISQGTNRLDDQDLQKMTDSGVRTERFPLMWSKAEPSEGSFDWADTDQFVGSLASRGIRPVPFVWGSPSWVARRINRPPIDTPAHEQAWKDFLKAAVARYQPGGSYWSGPYQQRFGSGATPFPIQAWQIWNEPNLKKIWAPKPSAPQYAELLHISNAAIKGQDSQAQIILGGIVGYGDPNAWTFLGSLYQQAGVKDDFDVAALHPYSGSFKNFRLAVQQFRAVMVRHDDAGTPLWITEFGWGSAPPDRFGINKGIQGQKNLLVRSFKLILQMRSAWHLQRVFWFFWRDPSTRPPGTCSFCGSAGLLRYDRTPKPSFNSFSGFAAEKTPPQATITSGPSPGALINDPTPKFSFTSNEPGSTFQCRVDSGSFEACGSPHRVAPLSDDPHTFSVKAIDAAGNESAIKSRSYTVDSTAPVVTISSGPADGSRSSDRNPSFGFATNDPSAHLSCQLDGGGFAPCTSPFTASNLADGSHSFRVKAVDRAKNQGSSASTWTVDTVAPTVTISSGPANGSTSADPSPSFSFTSDEAGSDFRCNVDSGGFAPCSSPYTADQLADGHHTFQVRAIDRAGNTGSAVSRAWTIHAPEITIQITSGPGAGSVTNDPTPGFAFSASDSGAGFACRVDGAAFTDCSSPFTLSRLADGQHRFRVKAVHGARQSAVLMRSFTIDTRAPAVRITSGPHNGSSSSDHRHWFSFTSNESRSRFRCKLDSAGFSPCSSPFATGRLANGSYTFKVLAIDRAGNRGDPRDVRFRVDTVAPTLRIDGPRKVTIKRRNDASVSFTLRASEPVSRKCRVASKRYEPCSLHYRTPKLGLGPHSLWVKATDRAGNVSHKRKRFKIVNGGGGHRAAGRMVVNQPKAGGPASDAGYGGKGARTPGVATHP